jgi:glycerol-1-phosphate dehydrogenase [NAD(P)+]
MISAGLGDLLGKYTSLADWKLGHLLYGEPFRQSVYDLMKRSVDDAVAVIDEIAGHSCDGISRLMDGLVGSGFGMLEFGDSRPASGSEHHIAHFWEMHSILEGKTAILHGAEVGVGTILSARRYQQLREISFADAHRYLSDLQVPAHSSLDSEIEQGYGPVAQKIRQIQSPLYSITQDDLDRLMKNILDHWKDIMMIASEVPSPKIITEWIQAVGGPTQPDQIRYDERKARNGIHFAHYLRDRFTVNRLSYWLKLPEDDLL